MARVVLENLTKVFAGARGEEILAVNHLHLAVEDKELLVLVGPSGCGKSTTLRLIAGLEKATCGSISIDSQVVNDVEPKDRDLAMVFQNHALYPHLTVYENLAFGLTLRKVPGDQIRRRVQEAAEMLGLAACLNRLPAALSGGQRQRVAVGRAIVRQPKVFLFDEPLSNLDAPMRAQMRVELSKLHRRLGATMIYVTHDQVEAMTLGDRIAAMDAGVIQQIGDPGNLYDRPTNQFVAGFIGSPPMNVFHGSITRRDGSLFFEEQVLGAEGRRFMVRVNDRKAEKLVSFIGRKIVLGMRPEAIADGVQTGGAAAMESGVEARLEVVEPLGPETYLHLTTGAHPFVARSRSDRRSDINRRLQLGFDMSQAHFFDPATGAAIV